MNHTVCTVCNNAWIFDNSTVCNKCVYKTASFLKILDCVKVDGDMELIIGDVSDIIVQNQLKLTDVQIRKICDTYFKNGEKTSERLTITDKLFLDLHHVNGMVN
jgi:hypothetical protein